jgi:hypothetical protein
VTEHAKRHDGRVGAGAAAGKTARPDRSRHTQRKTKGEFGHAHQHPPEIIAGLH